MISLNDYFGQWYDHPDATAERKEAAQEMLDKVNALLIEAEANGVELQTNPHTKTYISGYTYGGFRPLACQQGSANSSHKEGRGVDVYDPDEALDHWITDARLKSYQLFREAPSSTPGWCHLTDRSPPSGRRTFNP